MMDFISNAYVAIYVFLHDMVNAIFGPVLRSTLKPINDMFTDIFQPWAMIVTLTFFFLTMLWVCLILKPSYLAKDAPSKAIWCDLRVWTVVSMMPHVVVYFFF